MQVGSVGLVAALMVSNASARTSDGPLQPTSKWVVEFADNQCLLSRSYGTAAKPLVLSFEQFPMEPGIDVYLFKSSNRRDMNYGDARIGFATGGQISAKFDAYPTVTNLRRIGIEIHDNSYKAAAVSEVVWISIKGEVEDSFSVPGLAEALKVMRDCVVDLGEHWGISAEYQRRISKPPKPVKPLGKYFSAADYPMKALMNDASGRTNVRIEVDEKGLPTSCVVMKPSGNKALDKETCRILLDRARFLPALDINGRPSRGIIVTAVNWVIG